MLPKKAKDIFEKRLALLRASKDDRDRDSNAIKISPECDGRMRNLAEPMEH